MKRHKSNYSRRSFIVLTGGATLLSMVRYPAIANSFVSKTLPDADGREQYALHLLERLCTDIGPRATGTPQYAQGARIIKEEMARSLPVVGYDEYRFERWELIGEPEFFVGRQYIETYPAFGSGGTPPSGLTGILERREQGFVLIDPATKETKALITVSGYGRAIPIYYRGWAKEQGILSFGVGKQDVPIIERAMRYRTSARLKAQVRFSPNAQGMNIIGQFPGKIGDEILLVAHADTPYNSPGAIDNTSSVIVMLMLAHAMAGSGLKHTVTFVATDAEEYGYLGATHYAKGRAADDTMKNIKYVINFDSLAWGPNLWLNSLDDELQEIIRSIHSDLGIDAVPRFERADGFVMDSGPFRASGAKALWVNSRGYDEKTLPLYHRPDDDARHLPLDCLEVAFQVFNEFIKRIDSR